MLLFDKCRYFFLFLFLPLSLFCGGDYADSIRKIQESREKIWIQLVDLAQRDDSLDADKSVELISSTGNRLAVSQAFARTLLSLDSFGHLKRTDERYRGHHPVVHLGDLFFKSDVCLPPLDPMMETAVFFFHSLLFKEGVVPSDFIFVKNLQLRRMAPGSWDERKIQQVLLEQEESLFQQGDVQESSFVIECQDHLLQVSQAIYGERATNFLSAVDERSRSLDELDTSDFQRHCLSDLLLVPGDHKSENFIVTPDFPKKHLINIDNDGVFYHTCVMKNRSGEFSDKQPFGGCKNVLFLLEPLMNRPIDPLILEDFGKLNVEDVLHVFLSLLIEQNIKVQAIFDENPAFLKRYETNYMPLRFPEHAIFELKEKMYRIQSFLKSSPNCSVKDLFSALYPTLSQYYSWMLQQHKTYLKALGKLYSNERPFSEGRTATNRIGIKPLKGRWIFQALQQYKKSRKTQLRDSMKELDLPSSEVFAENSLLNASSDVREVLLKNSDDDLWREWVSQDFLQALCSGQVPEAMKNVYPYSYLHDQVGLLCQNDRENSVQKVFTALKEFSATQKAYEDFVFYFFEKPCEESALPEGILKCAKSISTNVEPK